MPKTIEERWKDVGMKYDDVAEVIHKGYMDPADALLPLIEKAVQEGRSDELNKTVYHALDEGECLYCGLAEEAGHGINDNGEWITRECYYTRRRAELEAGND